MQKVYMAIIVLLLVIAVVCFGFYWVKKDKND
jgi:uncharacterized membrane protein YsdA (DUF1294 family)